MLYHSALRLNDSDELVLITQPALRSQLLQARLVDEFSARCVIQRGENVYLSLREIPDNAKRQEISQAVIKLQAGVCLKPQDLPDPLRTALSVATRGPSPLIQALIWGAASGVVGGVLAMAIVGLTLTVLNVPGESFLGIAGTAVAFVFSAALLGIGFTIYFWQKFMQ